MGIKIFRLVLFKLLGVTVSIIFVETHIDKYFKENVLIMLEINSLKNIEENIDKDLNDRKKQIRLKGKKRLQNFIRTKLLKHKLRSKSEAIKRYPYTQIFCIMYAPNDYLANKKKLKTPTNVIMALHQDLKQIIDPARIKKIKIKKNNIIKMMKAFKREIKPAKAYQEYIDDDPVPITKEEKKHAKSIIEDLLEVPYF